MSKRISSATFLSKVAISASIVFLGIFGVTENSLAKNLYVNNSGSPACSDNTTYANNSASNPWCTLLRAVRGNSDGNRNTAAVPTQAAQAGDTVYVTAGIYHYSGTWNGDSWTAVLYNPVNSGTSSAWITFQAVGTVHLTGNVGTEGALTSGTIGSNSGEYIKWSGFTMNQANGAWRNGMINVGVNNIIIENNTVIGVHTVFSHGGDNHPGIMIHGPRSGDCTGGIGNITVRNNTISGFTGGSSRNDAGITLYCLGNNITIENNIIHSNWTGLYFKTQYHDTTNNVIRYNYIYNNGGDAIAMQASSGWRITNNLFNNNNIGIKFFCTHYYQGNSKPNNIYFVNNTVYGGVNGVQLSRECSRLAGNHVKNNLFINTTYGHGADGYLTQCSLAQNLEQADIHFNHNFYQYSSNRFHNDADDGSYWWTFAAWQSATYNNQDANSSNNTNPLFIDAAAGNFRLQSGSPAINYGVDILDLDGDGQTNDPITLGAYITGNEVIGINTGGTPDATPPASPTGLTVI